MMEQLENFQNAIKEFYGSSVCFEFQDARDFKIKDFDEKASSTKSPMRQKEVAASRASLSRFKKINPIYTSSISHSDGHVFTLGIGHDKMIQQVGVDIERCERKVSTRVSQRFIQSSEKAFLLSSLDIWVIKEACFKADPFNEGEVISKYFIEQFSWMSQQGVVTSPAGHQIEFRLIDTGEWKVALAKTETNTKAKTNAKLKSELKSGLTT